MRLATTIASVHNPNCPKFSVDLNSIGDEVECQPSFRFILPATERLALAKLSVRLRF